jgi:polysaccharide deacetylase family protein (PEP-CTERM system associated)
MSDMARNEEASQDAFHVFTADVEEYFQVEAFAGYLDRSGWDVYPRRVEENTGKLLDLLAAHGVRGTFFVLGSVARTYPGLIRRIGSGGHEIASHGFDHVMLSQMSADDFRSDVRRSKAVLEDIAGRKVQGYRAPTFSITPHTTWAYSILLDEGFRYSSSVFPIRHDRYGWPAFGQDPRITASNGRSELWEVPLSVACLGPLCLPFGGGGYLRAYPFVLTRALFRRRLKAGNPAIMYVHPWELDVNHPGITAPWLTRVRHFQGIPGMTAKLERLFRSMRFDTMTRFLDRKGALS